MKIAIVKLDREITNANVCKRCGENVKMKQPLITIEGKDCKPCKTKEHDRVYHLNFGRKSPTELIFDAEEFKCYKIPRLWSSGKEITHKNCHCKGTGYLLPKKGDVKGFCKCGHEHYEHDEKHKKGTPLWILWKN